MYIAMYEKVEKQMTPRVRLMTGAVLFLTGLIWQIASGKTLDMYAYYFMSASTLCLSGVIMAKISKAELRFFPFIFINMTLLIVVEVIATATVPVEEPLDSMGMTVQIGIFVIGILLGWAVNAFLLSCDRISKRVGMGLVTTILNVILFGIIFMIPVLIAANK